MSDQSLENWEAGEAYEQYVGRWSRRAAPIFLEWLSVPAGTSWTDVGCGTGALVEDILSQCSPEAVVGIDQSEGFITEASRHTSDHRARFPVGNATDLPLQNATSEATVSGLVLNFVSDPAQMLREMVRVTKPGGRVAAYVWDYAEGMEMMRHFWAAAATVSPQDANLDEAQRFPLCQPAPFAALWTGAGLNKVEVQGITIPTVFRDFEDYWTPFLGKQGAAPTYLASLGAEIQEQIRTVLHSRLKPSPDGTVALTARAWAVQGTKPG